MTKRAILLECSAPHWVPVAQQIAENGIEVVYWSAWSPAEQAICAAFPSAIFHNTIDAKRANPAPAMQTMRVAFDEVCQAIWASEAQTVYDMMNRFDTSRDMNNVERSMLFMQMLLYWRGVLNETKPHLVIFPAPPHVVYDYVVLALCREIGVQTLMFEEATILPPYRIEMDDYVHGDMNLARAVASVAEISLEASAIAERLRGSYAQAKPYREVEAHRRMAEARAEGVAGAFRQLEAVFVIDKAHLGSNEVNPKIVNVTSLEKERGVSLKQSFEGPFANTRYMRQRYEERTHTDKLAELYARLCRPLEEIEGPIVYFPMAGQPERTSNPQAGIFTNQLLIVNILSASMPDGWTLVVKDHPNQFHPEFAVNMCRSEEYYEVIAAHANVRIVSTQQDPFTLIDRCAIVATTGGTSALEGIARGKPALLFGDAWYRDCPGVVRVRNLSDAQQAFAAMPAVPHSALERFLQAVMSSCATGMADYPPDGYELDEKSNVRNLAASITNRLLDA
ncbi:MAG TPA: hypothetical protein VGN60_13580 [Devosia sp.]|jgi:hypothetical protein|nr:hypothetical protein [Devosia sp.]